MTAKSTLITFEGLGGSGKSTIAKAVAAWLESKHVSVLLTKEPGGTPIGQELRSILLNSENVESFTPWAEAFLFEADRALTYEKVILPALTQGRVVISDRNLYGTIAYQGFGRKLNLDVIDTMNRVATQGYVPDLIFVVDVDPEMGIARKRKDNTQDRFDEEELTYQRDVRSGYLYAASRDIGRAHVIDANQPLDVVLQSVQSIISQHLWGKQA